MLKEYSLGGVLRSRRKLFTAGLAILVVNRSVGLIPAGSVKILLDDVIGRQQTTLLSPLIAVVAASLVVEAISGYLLTTYLDGEGHKLAASIRMGLQRHVYRLPVSYFDRRRGGEVVSNIMTDVDRVRLLVRSGVVQLIGGGLTMLGSLVMLLWISPLMAALALASVCVMGVVAARPLKNLENIAREHNVLYGQLMGTVTEAIASIRVVKGYQKEGRLDEVFSGGATRLLESARRMLAVTARIELGTMLTFVG